ncbi:MAG: hypothetical protein P8M11_14745 [Planctomycetota bacterium]|nr:hypothetical protein [Planctomycetota bacterium]
MEPPRGEHPLDGVWVPVGPLVEAGDEALQAAAREGAAGVTCSDSDLQLAAEPGARPLPLRVDLDPERVRAEGPGRMVALRPWLPDLVGLPVGDLPASTLHDCLAAAEDEDHEVVLLVHDAREAAVAADLAETTEQVVGFSVARLCEDALDLLATRDHLGLATAAPEFASAYRHGAGGLEGFPASLSPRASAWLLSLCRDEVDAALLLERRLLRFLEGHLRPAARRLQARDSDASPRAQATLYAAVGGWLEEVPARGDAEALIAPGGVDPVELRAHLVRQIPEMARFTP